MMEEVAMNILSKLLGYNKTSTKPKENPKSTISIGKKGASLPLAAQLGKFITDLESLEIL